jgi:hypothetical protein
MSSEETAAGSGAGRQKNLFDRVRQFDSSHCRRQTPSSSKSREEGLPESLTMRRLVSPAAPAFEEDEEGDAAPEAAPERDADAAHDDGEQDEPQAKRRKAVVSEKTAEKAQEASKKRGLVYLSRLPPFMKPAKLRFLLQQHAEVLRIYLAAEGEGNEGAAAGSTRASRPARRGRAHAAQARWRQQRQAFQGGVSAPPSLPQASSLLTPPPLLPTPPPAGSSLRTRRLRVASPSS